MRGELIIENIIIIVCHFVGSLKGRVACELLILFNKLFLVSAFSIKELKCFRCKCQRIHYSLEFGRNVFVFSSSPKMMLQIRCWLKLKYLSESNEYFHSHDV